VTHPNDFHVLKPYKEAFFRLLGVIMVAMASLRGEMNPGKKMGSKYHLVSEI